MKDLQITNMFVFCCIFARYQYHGGTNFGRNAAGLFVATSYDYDAPIDEYGNLLSCKKSYHRRVKWCSSQRIYRAIVWWIGLLNEPKYGHLRDLHKAIKQCEPALVSSYPTVTWPGKNQEVNIDIILAFQLKLLFDSTSNILYLRRAHHPILRFMSSDPRPGLVLPFSPTTTLHSLRSWHSKTCSMICPLGRSAFSPTARLLFTTLQE